MTQRPISVSFHKHAVAGRWTGKWRLVAEYHRKDELGHPIKRVRHYPEGRGATCTQTEAGDEALRWASELNSGDKAQIDPSTITVAQWADTWLRDKVAMRAPSYRYNCELLVEREVKGTFLGGLRLQAVTPADIERWLRHVRGKVAKPGTVAAYYQTIRTLFNAARKARLISEAPTVSAVPPELAGARNAKMDDAWSTEDCQRFIALESELTSTEERMALWALFTGMRVSEIIALRWEEVDWTNNEVRVTRSATYLREGGKTRIGVKDPKTVHGRRNIGLHPGSLALLRRQQKAQLLDRQGAARYHDNGLVFASPTGELLSRSNVYNRFRRLTERLGLPRMRFHALRHCYATIMLGLFKEHVQVVAAAMGHADATVTMRVYSHHISGMFEQSNAMWARLVQMSGGGEHAVAVH